MGKMLCFKIRKLEIQLTEAQYQKIKTIIGRSNADHLGAEVFGGCSQSSRCIPGPQIISCIYLQRSKKSFLLDELIEHLKTE